MTIYRPGHHVVIPGARVLQPGGGEAPWWMAAGVTPVLAYQAKGAASYAASLVNLANPGTYDLAEIAAPTWDAAIGWQCTPLTELRVTIIRAWAGCSVLVQFSGLVGIVFPCGLFSYWDNNGDEITMVPWRAGGVLSYGACYSTGSPVLVPPQLSSGNMGIAGPQGYRNGIADGAAMSNPNANTNSAGYLKTAQIAGNIQAVVLFSETLSAAQMAAMAAAMAAL